MSKVTAASLRRRWSDPVAAEPLVRDALAFLATGTAPGFVDLRGAEIGNQGPLHDFRFIQAAFSRLDLSHGKGALIASGATITDLVADRFAFDRASSLRRSSFHACRFPGAHLHLNATDVEFHDCDFSTSTFAGGFNEYGFRRCRFFRCNFSGILWRNTFLRACEMHDCIYDDGHISNSVVAGLRISGAQPAPSFLEASTVAGLVVSSPADTPGAA
jgi:uncharacterized protein YjbI with pentapeptide repeats